MAASYTFTTLDNAGAQFNELLGINNAGQVVGYFGNGNGPNPTGYELSLPYQPLVPQGSEAYLYTNRGSYSVAGALTMAEGINNEGTIVGAGSTSPGGALQGLSFGTSATIAANGTASPVGGATQVLGINDAGLSVGFEQKGSIDSAVTIAAGAKAAALTLPGGAAALEATGINNENVIVGVDTVPGATKGSSLTEGFIYDTVAGKVTQLAGPTGATLTEALGINNEGQVVGEYVDAAGTHGFVYDIASGGYTTIDDPNASGLTVVNGINDLGQIVGYYRDAGGITHGMVGAVTGGVETVSSPTAGTTIAVGYGMGGVAVQGSSGVTLLDAGFGHVILHGNVGADTIHAWGAADTIVGSSGSATIAATGAGDLMFLGGGVNSVVAAAAAEIVGTSGTDNIDAYGGGVVFAGAGKTTVGGGAAGAALTVVGGTGSLVASASSAAGSPQGSVLFGASGASTLSGGGGRSVIVGGSGTIQAAAGVGGGVIWGGTGSGVYLGNTSPTAAPTTFVVGQGQSFVYAENNDVVFLVGGKANVVSDSTVSGANDTLVATASSGQNTFLLTGANTQLYAGAGATAIVVGSTRSSSMSSSVVGGSGRDVYYVSKGGGGTLDIFHFRVGTDAVVLNGYSASEAKTDLAGATYAGGSTKLTLSDGTKLDFIGAHVTLSSFA